MLGEKRDHELCGGVWWIHERLLGSVSTDGVCGWPKHRLFLFAKMGAVVERKGQKRLFVLVVLSWPARWPAIMMFRRY